MKGLIAVMLGVFVIGCGSSGGGSGGNGASGVPSGKRLDALTDAEKGMFCDWTNAKFGGYGMSMDCGGFTLEGDASQADCVASFYTSCAVTVAQAEACANAASCSNLAPSQCAPLANCQ